ncbi:type I pullulanase [Paenibacillus sp. CAA11]|uniref:type I pullulanase n=1 Tax=Paenibacillus sp. CAA11 TaxID=1532905 RepID=UPI000D37E4E9|nr:type I pullulanase [Paenibacillus sp. CAA11]AWB44472.1 type I pullulanase [Paenibacillus sp. CAA11]
MSVQKERDIVIDYGDPVITGGISVFDPEFDKAYYYDGNDLGATYSPKRTQFRLWAPTASEAWVFLYDSWDDDRPDKRRMRRDVKGTWILSIDEDLQNRYYTYCVHVGEQINEAVDPYAKAVGVNGDRGAIIDLQKTNPAGWTEEKPPLESPLDAIIYEVHLRDLSIHPASGIEHKGKYLGLAEGGTKGPGGISTGLDHISNLGVTHVQILPFYDYSTESVDETRLDEPQYNWGYDPKNYNVPEGSYATDPYKPAVRIAELKQMIQALHDRGLRVVMDVVYNHVYDGYIVNFTRLVPGYYLRYTPDHKFSNGSGCGNDVASERRMVTKFIVDSVLYWAREYHIDGFRFDLMGLLDVNTMNELRRRLDEVDPSILLYGEGWMMDTALPPRQRANQQQAGRMPKIGHFNDVIRNALKGHVFEYTAQGFVTGGKGLEDEVRKGVVGGIAYNDDIVSFVEEPVQSINYVECHDNHTLWDKIMLSTGTDSNLLRPAMHRLASAIILTSQGIPFIHAGQEFLRTKDGVENSYKSEDLVNRLDWDRCNVHQEDVQFMKRLIELRKEHAAFRLRDADSIRKHLVFEKSPKQTVAFTLRNHAGGDQDKHLYVAYSACVKGAELDLPQIGTWEIQFGEELVSNFGEELQEKRLQIKGIGMVVLAVKA